MLFLSYQFLLFLLFAYSVSLITPSQLGFLFTSIVFYLVFGNLVGLVVAILLAFSFIKIRSNKLVIFISISALIFFKYSNFIFHIFDLKFHFEDIFILGLSFFVFEIIHLSVERHRGNIASPNSLNVMNFIFFWPTMVAGPIKRYGDFSLVKYFSKNKEDYIYAGIMIACGYAIKYLSDNLSEWISMNDGLYINSPNLKDKVVFILILGMRIYWDFAGYSLIAIGFARVFGIHVPQNFNYPYFASNIVSFWKRWHISLSSWIKDYVYIPLGGNKNHRYINLFIAMALCGLWHGPSWNFVLWGAVHGIALIVCHMAYRFSLTRVKLLRPFGLLFSWILTQAFVFTMWLPFFYPLEICRQFFMNTVI